MTKDYQMVLARNRFYYHRNLLASRKYAQEKQKRLLSQRKSELAEVLGNFCVLCGSKNHIHYHEIHGNSHYSHTLTRKEVNYRLKHKDDFVCLCRRCHLNLHRVARFFEDTNTELLSSLLKSLISSQPKNKEIDKDAKKD
jgi:predicted HNH restriction endonuclease